MSLADVALVVIAPLKNIDVSQVGLPMTIAP
jgi:hypothetical protein